MTRWAFLVPALFLLVLAAVRNAAASVPYPPYCSVTPADQFGGIVLAPDNPQPIPSSIETIVIRQQNNFPYPGAQVQITFGPGVNLCHDTVLQGTTDANGRFVVRLGGGGCIDNADQACLIRAEGVVIRNFRNVKSPDYDGSGGNLTVDLADLIEFSRERAAGHGGCHDYDNDGSITLGDVVVFSSAFSPAHNCP